MCNGKESPETARPPEMRTLWDNRTSARNRCSAVGPARSRQPRHEMNDTHTPNKSLRSQSRGGNESPLSSRAERCIVRAAMQLVCLLSARRSPAVHHGRAEHHEQCVQVRDRFGAEHAAVAAEWQLHNDDDGRSPLARPIDVLEALQPSAGQGEPPCRRGRLLVRTTDRSAEQQADQRQHGLAWLGLLIEHGMAWPTNRIG